jgi:hypothetical protein
LPVAGRAAPILIGSSGSSIALTFTAQSPPNGTLEVSSGGFSAPAGYQANTGSATFGKMDFFTGTVNAGSPPFFTPNLIPPANEDFKFQAGPDSLDATITWTELTAPAVSVEPQLFGTGLINTSSGDSQFEMDFPAGGGISISSGLNFPLAPPICSLADLAAGSSNCNGLTREMSTLEGGDAMPGPPNTTPEPMSSLMALGVALSCLWGTRQMMRRQRDRSGS